MGRDRVARSKCPIATSLDLFGDRWTLVIVRDMLVGKKRFGEFLASREAITTNVLADRLEQMEQAGLIERQAYQANPQRFEYQLTPKGRGLLPMLQELCRWADKFLPGTMEPPMNFMDLKV
ncbi:MAG: transcriptional regulator [Hyphomicrobiales bacterium]|nr:transcriptional regulator [Hyphomicrobiales bacterium]